MAAPKLTHVFDLVITGPAGFSYTASTHSNACVAHGESGYVYLPDGTAVFRVVTATDWMSTGPTNMITIDARASAVSDDGLQNLDVMYMGKFEVTPEMEVVISGKGDESSAWGSSYYYTTPRFSSRSAEWAWVNDAVFIASGKLASRDGRNTASYRVYKVG